MDSFFENYCSKVIENFGLLRARAAELDQARLLMLETLRKGDKILVCGNGGSAADAQHFAAELMGRFEKERAAQPAIALTTDTSALTAIGNDYGFDKVFSRQVQALGQPGDLLIAISTSGNSKNVLKAIEAAETKNMKILMLTGQDGGQMGGSDHLCLQAPSSRTSHIQEMHIAILHMLCCAVEDDL